MRISKHARTRGQQRGISEAYMVLLLAFGKDSKAKNGAVSISFDKHGLRLLEMALREDVQIIDKIKNKKVIYNVSDDTIITCCVND